MKFNLTDTIYYLKENKIHSAPVLARKCVENDTEVFFESFGANGVLYGTCHGIVNESDAFASREELKESL